MFFRIVMICAGLAILYAGWQIVTIRSLFTELAETPSFAQKSFPDKRNQSSLRIVEFANYGCVPCKNAQVLILNYLEDEGGASFSVRPVPFEGDAEKAALVAISAGLQGKFWEMNEALTQYNGPVSEKFLKETASLYGMDYERLMLDAKSKKVFEIAQDNAHAFMRAGIEKTPAYLIGKTVYQPDTPLTLNDLISMLQREKTQKH